ncbi:MAG: hypothetical protein IJ152_02445 [Bacteroidales bacterium]|nr:hypothetical protein [Bacteroidales bacterium]
MDKPIDLYEIFPKAKGIQFPMRIPRKVKPKPPPKEDTESLVERYAAGSVDTLRDTEEISNIINNA